MIDIFRTLSDDGFINFSIDKKHSVVVGLPFNQKKKKKNPVILKLLIYFYETKPSTKKLKLIINGNVDD